MTDTLEHLKSLLEQAVPGTWNLEEVRSVTDNNGSYATFHNAIRRYGDSFEVKQRLVADGQQFADDTCELIVAAVNALPKLIACAEALEKATMALKNGTPLEKQYEVYKIAHAALAALSKVQP